MTGTGVCQLLVTADDRTGALEVGGAIATDSVSVPVGPRATCKRCCVVDAASRHLSPAAAQAVIASIHERPAELRCHKMDSGLRGNWTSEVAALLDLGYRVAIVPAYPDAGRTCRDGVVYIHGVPVTESPFGQDPLNAPVSSRPGDMLAARGLASRDVVVWDADDNDALAAAVRRCRAERRVLVGPTGAVGAYAATVFGAAGTATPTIRAPVTVLCGSLNQVSREQIAALDVPLLDLDAAADPGAPLTVFATDTPRGVLTAAAAEHVASRLAATARRVFTNGTLLVIGGDTAAAVIGETTVNVVGSVDTAMPAGWFAGGLLVTKGGGIGRPDTLKRLLSHIR